MEAIFKSDPKYVEIAKTLIDPAFDRHFKKNSNKPDFEKYFVTRIEKIDNMAREIHLIVNQSIRDYVADGMPELVDPVIETNENDAEDVPFPWE